MLKKSWDEISKKTIQNCFRKAGISAQSHESAMDENDDLFKKVLCNGDAQIGELEFNLNQFRQVIPELAPANLNTNELVELMLKLQPTSRNHWLWKSS